MSEHELRVVIEAVGWTLVHFLWQGALIAGALALALAATRGRPARERYLLRLAALGAMALAPALTFAWLRPEAAVASGAAVAASAAPATSVWSLGEPLPWIVLLWLSGVAFFALRLAGGAWQVLRLPQRLGAEPLPPRWRRTFERVARDLGVRARARLVRGARITVPTVVGWVRPIVLLPARVFYGLTEQQVEALIAHELAHVARFDPLVNLAQSVVETLLFYHPAVWWVSRGIRAEREFCCDDLAVAVCRDGLSYARALAVLEGWRGARAQPGVSTLGGELMQRIQRLVGRGPVPPARPRPARALGAVLALGALGSTAFALSALPAAGAVHDCKCSCHTRTRASAPPATVEPPAAAGERYVLRVNGDYVLVDPSRSGNWVEAAPPQAGTTMRHRVSLGADGELDLLVVEGDDAPQRVIVNRATPEDGRGTWTSEAPPEDGSVFVEELAPGRYEVQVVGPQGLRVPRLRRIELPEQLRVQIPKVEVLVVPQAPTRVLRPDHGDVRRIELAPEPRWTDAPHELHEDAPGDDVLHQRLEKSLHEHLQRALHEHLKQGGQADSPRDLDVEQLHRHLMETLHEHLQKSLHEQRAHDPRSNVHFAPAPDASFTFGDPRSNVHFAPAPDAPFDDPRSNVHFAPAPDAPSGDPRSNVHFEFAPDAPAGDARVDGPHFGRFPAPDAPAHGATDGAEHRGVFGGRAVRGFVHHPATEAHSVR